MASSAPIIVQGEPVITSNDKVQYAQESTGSYIAPVHLVEGNTSGAFNGKGEQQPVAYRDVGFALAFLAHLAIVILSMVMFGSGLTGDYGASYSGVIYCVVVTGIVGISLSSLSLAWMMRHSETLVKSALIFSVGTSLAMGILGAMFGSFFMAILGFISFGVGCCYAKMVWPRIPFAAANLNTALTGVRANFGITGVAYIFLTLAFIWTIVWGISTGGAAYSSGEAVLFLCFLSFYWTHQVLSNTVTVTTSGVIGTWWFAPVEASSCFSQAVKDSLRRSCTYSFGSICFGSLIVAIVQALRQVQHQARSQDDCQILVLIVDCILGCIESIIEYMNKWAYVYVGLYGYSYLEAGKNVITLFKSKGWTSIITDDLVDNVLLMVSIGIGLVCGLVGLILSSLDANLFSGVGYYQEASMVGFTIGFLVGLVLSSVALGVVGSAVNTVIVLFAEAPAEFHHNHPELSNEMRESWRHAWPEECGNIV